MYLINAPNLESKMARILNMSIDIANKGNALDVYNMVCLTMSGSKPDKLKSINNMHLPLYLDYNQTWTQDSALGVFGRVICNYLKSR